MTLWTFFKRAFTVQLHQKSIIWESEGLSKNSV